MNAVIAISTYVSQLRISRYDRKPLSPVDLTHSAVIEVTQAASELTDETTTLTLPVPEDGDIHIKFKLQDHVAIVHIQVSISVESTWKYRFVVRNMSRFTTVGLNMFIVPKMALRTCTRKHHRTS